MNQKQVTIKLFYNEAIQQYYVQMSDYLFMVKANVAYAIRDREGLVIRRAKELKEIQILSGMDDDKEK